MSRAGRRHFVCSTRTKFMANVLSVIWFIIGTVVTLASLLVWPALMMPGPVRRARLRLEAKPVASFFLGVLFCAATFSLFLGFMAVRMRSMAGVYDAIMSVSAALNLGMSGYITNTLFRILHL